MTLLLILALAVPAFAANRDAAKDFVVLDDTNITLLEKGAPKDIDIELGNPEGAYQNAVDWFMGHESVAYPIDESQIAACPEGFAPIDATLFMAFGAEDVPVTFTMVGALRDADMTDPNCVKPGERLVQTPYYSVTIETAGSYAITLPFDETAPVCTGANGPWFVEMEMPDWFETGMSPDALIDATPTSCTSWYNFYLLGWEDMVADYGWEGDVILKMGAGCCYNSIPNESTTWGAVKQSYR